MSQDFLSIFRERGFFHQCTDEEGLSALLKSGPVTAYIGFDCTATSLHVGSLMQIMVLRWLKKCGHKPIILFGGATTKIGDPSGKDQSRPKIDDATIATNMAGIRKTFDQFGLQDVPMVNNNDWMSKLSALELIELAENFSVNRMLTFDSVKLRLEREGHLSLKEFLYMVIQGYDFAHLAKPEKDGGKACRLQIGGSDQWGNIVNGVELWRRLAASGRSGDRLTPDLPLGRDIFGLTTPLITTSSGAKMGKTADGAVWLTTELVLPSFTQTSSYDYWQFWRNTEDKDVFKFLRLFTELSIEEIAQMEREMQGADINKAKIILANEATRICHGIEAATHAEETARKVFEQGGVGDDLPTVEIPRSELEVGIPAHKILHMAGLVDSGGEAKNLIKGGGAKVNDAKITDITQAISLADLNSDGVIKLSAGKKKHAVVRVV